MSKPSKSVVILNQDKIIDLVSKGYELQEVIDELKLNITPNAITNKLSQLKEYKKARIDHLEAKLSYFEKRMIEATDMPTISRTRELIKLYQWRLRYHAPDRYQDRPNVAIQINNQVPTADALGKEASELISKIK